MGEDRECGVHGKDSVSAKVIPMNSCALTRVLTSSENNDFDIVKIKSGFKYHL